MIKKTVLITGSSRGIGESCARIFANNGYNVVINYLKSEEKAYKIAREIPDSIAVKADVSKRSEVQELVRKATDTFGNIDVLVNNAGISRQKLFTDITEEDWEQMFDINIKGLFNCCQEILPFMIKKHSGKIINVSSIWGMVGASCEVHYSASKGAVISFTKALAKELGPSNIQVNCVAPGFIDTDMNSTVSSSIIKELKEKTPLGVIGTPNDVANLILYLSSRKSDFITGQIISPNGGFVI